MIDRNTCEHTKIAFTILEEVEQHWEFNQAKGEWEKVETFTEKEIWDNVTAKCIKCGKQFLKKDLEKFDFSIPFSMFQSNVYQTYYDHIVYKVFKPISDKILEKTTLPISKLSLTVPRIRDFKQYLKIYVFCYSDYKIPKLEKEKFTEECYQIQNNGFNACFNCYLKDDKMCRGKNIKKTGKNLLGYDVPLYADIIIRQLQEEVIKELSKIKEITISNDEIHRRIPIEIYLRFYEGNIKEYGTLPINRDLRRVKRDEMFKL